MGILFKNSTIFADVKNIVISTDAIVASRLNDFFTHTDGPRFFFIDEIEKFYEINLRMLSQLIIAEKRSDNFLLDYFDWAKCSMNPEINPYQICNFTYRKILNRDYEYTNDQDIFDTLNISQVMTSIGKSLASMGKDNSINGIYLFMDEDMPDTLIKCLSIFFTGSTNIKIIKGNKKSILGSDKYNFDIYFLESPDEVELIKNTEKHQEIFIPNSTSNMTIAETEKGTQFREFNCHKEKENQTIYVLNLPI